MDEQARRAIEALRRVAYELERYAVTPERIRLLWAATNVVEAALKARDEEAACGR